jgi:hypothetical protein
VSVAVFDPLDSTPPIREAWRATRAPQRPNTATLTLTLTLTSLKQRLARDRRAGAGSGSGDGDCVLGDRPGRRDR